MPNPQERLDAMLTDFGRQHPDHVASLRRVIDSTPTLKADMLTAIEKDNLTRFGPKKGRGSVGSYDPDDGSVVISLAELKKASHDTAPGRLASNGLRYTLAHEIQHGVNRDEIQAQDRQLEEGAQAKIAQGGPRDYTDLLRTYNETSRAIEVKAEIAGFNSFANFVREGKPDATLKDLYEASPANMHMYIDFDRRRQPPTYSAKDGLTIGDDLRIASTPVNLEAMGRIYYDANRYDQGEIARGLDVIARVEEHAHQQALLVDPQTPAPQMRVDLKALGVPRLALPDGFEATSAKRGPPRPEESEAQPASSLDPKRQRGPVEEAQAVAVPVVRDPFFAFLRERLPPEQVPDNAVTHAQLLAGRAGITDPSLVDPKAVGCVDGKIWIGGTGRAEGLRVSLDVAQAMPLLEAQQALTTFESQRAQGLPSPLPVVPEQQAAMPHKQGIH